MVCLFMSENLRKLLMMNFENIRKNPEPLQQGSLSDDLVITRMRQSLSTPLVI